ncbi:E3 ubiquitin-protein ligase Praja-2 [Spea bombifrons]|uniref:E3 ubiquitin-protein ligase Praja-2 n=1 Tax=Spea bombifrons TaxID=233779 RepID=UPI00234BCDA8|nr:E3 ubiquitin-protein ligase Praja-2 [Spea bombifrons]XP_053330383.1 E3 ubiquitin-protein ligase Praja-2 [Spea bombifrons]
MGQEACKAACPKPAGGYQTITGRRYGRRHAYVSFRPSLESPNRSSSQQISDCEGLELGDVQKENNLISKEINDSPIYNLGKALCVDLQEENTRHNVNNRISVLTEAERNCVSYFSVSESAKECQTSGNTDDCMKTIETHIMHQHPYQNGVSFVDIDSYEPDSSDGEENVCLSENIPLTKKTETQQKTLDNMLSKLEEDYFSENYRLSQVCTVSLDRCSSVDLDPEQAQANICMRPVSVRETKPVDNLGVHESQQKKHRIEVAEKSNTAVSCELNINYTKTDQGSEPVVRPKIRKHTSTSSCNKINSLTDTEGKDNTGARLRTRDLKMNAERICKDEKSQSDALFDPVNFEEALNESRFCSKDREPTNLQDKPISDDTFWDEFEVYGKRLSNYNKDEDSSVCSDGEWSTCLPSYFSTDKDHSSSDESWETLPGKEDHEVHSNSSSLEEENSDFCFQVEEQNSLEDGEIPWLQYNEDIESSTDEENDMGSHFVHAGFFMLDSNNNLEDDSSMSEDLEVEWRLLDDFGDGLGVAQAMSYVDPQFLTYMALEERLAQAMETALAHLESLAVDVEQAHPPATKESIDCLPQIVITDDRCVVGQEQCCAICCSEYIKDEILTELPCHHLFHKPCVTLWLQKSGTCPVCRHVLASLLPEAAATSFLSDHESPPSIHNAAGTR